MRTLALSCIVLLCSCAGTQTISDSDRSKVKKVSIARAVPMPPHPLVIGRAAQRATLLFGPLGMAASMSGDAEDVVEFERHAAEAKLDVPGLIRAEFAAELAERRAFGEVVEAEAPADATFFISVQRYGLGPGLTSQSSLRPVLAVTAKLVGRDGRVLWQGSDTLTGMSDLPAFETEKYYGQTGLLENSFKNAARLAAKNMLKDAGFYSLPAVTAANPPPGASAPPKGSLPLAMPRPGDVWKYRYLDGFSGRAKDVFVHEVMAVNASEISEKMYVAGRSAFADQQAFTPTNRLNIVQRSVANGATHAEFAPYLLAFGGDNAFGTLAPIGGSPSGGFWDMKARVVGREQVIVPAGSFNAIKIELTGERTNVALTWEASRIQHLIWYAPEVKRYVRYDINIWGGFRQFVKDRFELVEFALK